MTSVAVNVGVISEGIDWSRVTLPPCADQVIDRIEGNPASRANVRHAQVVAAYYRPWYSVPDTQYPSRQRRIRARQVVVVAPDGTIITTWYDGRGLYDGAVLPHRPATVDSAATGAEPAGYRDLMASLRDAGIELSLHERWGAHHRVHTPSGMAAFLPVDPTPGDDVHVDAALLRLLGCRWR